MFKKYEEIAPCILLIDDAIEDTDIIINNAMKKEKNGESKNAYIIQNNNPASAFLKEDIRKTKIINISPTFNNDKFWWELAQKIWQYGDEYGKKYEVEFSNMENPQFLWYKMNDGFYTPHIDTNSFLNRIFSLVLYLNDVEEGGETYFEYFDISIKPKSGRILLFPSNFSYLHGAKIPKSNDKFAIVTWFNGF